MRRAHTLCLALALLASIDLAAQIQPGWRYVASMNVERRMHTATLLAGGSVIVAGGTNRRHVAISSCERFSFRTLSWTDAAPMSTPRERHTATLLADGRVVVIGGNTESNWNNVVTASIEIYDPVADRWSPAGSLSTKRQNHTATLLPDGRILVTGGFKEDGENYLDECEIYDPAMGTSAPVASLPVGRMDHQALLLLDGRVLVAGGRIGGWNGNYLRQAEIYDPASDAWTVLDPMMQSRISGFTMAQFSDSSVLVAGGRNAPTSAASSAELLDVRYGQWQSIDTMHLPVTWQAGALLANDRYLVTGGFSDALWQTPNVVTATPTCEWYDRGARTWFSAPTMNTARAEHTIVHVTSHIGDVGLKEFVMVMGGILDGEQVTSTVEILDVSDEAMLAYRSEHSESGAPDLTGGRPRSLWITGNGGTEPAIIVSPSGGFAYVRLDLYAGDGTHLRRLVERVVEGTLRLPLPRELPSGSYLVRLEKGAGCYSVVKLVTAR